MVNFITQAYESEATTVVCSATTIRKLYPESTYYVYDGGLSKKSREKIDSFEHTKIIDWNKNATYTTNLFDSIKLGIYDLSKINMYTDHILNEVLRLDLVEQAAVKRMDFHHRQKPLSILDLTNKVEGNIVWIDADVVPINSFDEIYEYEFDLGGTIRSKYEEIYRENASNTEPATFNSGVIFFNTDSDRISAIVREWLKQIDDLTLTKLREQHALSKLFKQSNPDIYESYNNTGSISVDGENFQTKVFSCYTYNHFRLMSGINPKKHKFLHFKQGPSSSDKQINRQLIDDIKRGRLDKWYRNHL